jgi:dienelactone hydrolase
MSRMLRRRCLMCCWLLALGLDGIAPAVAGEFQFDLVGDRFTYTDSQRSFSGRYVEPAGAMPVGALVLNHGQGGAPESMPNWSTFTSWGVVLIAPELTHVLGGETAPPTTGHNAENLARGIACVRVLQQIARVDPSRIGFFGHSKGAYAAIGQVSALGAEIRVAAMTAGGVLPDSAGVDQAAPTHAESAGVVAPFLILHGNIDEAVPPERSLDFANRLTQALVANERHVYDVSALLPPVQHNLHQDPTINADLLARLHAWYELWGLFGADASRVFAHGFEDAAAP